MRACGTRGHCVPWGHTLLTGATIMPRGASGPAGLSMGELLRGIRFDP